MVRVVTIRLAAFTAMSVAMSGICGAQRLTGPHPTGDVPAPVALETRGQFQEKFARVGNDVFISGQPTELALRDLRGQGVTTVVNLRTPEEMSKRVPFDEAALVKNLGMQYVYIPVRGNAEFPYSPEAVKSFAAAMGAAKGKVLLHCTIAWRASHLWAAYLIQYRNVPVSTALQQARAINLMDDMRMDEDQQPVEGFLGRALPEVGHPKRN
ncbi:MAG: sulfur transferase domain-containing protein [Gemmatimonadota bacterium]|nr:sulfur transferase domain-containing protein [Gemmatimonadota bacterium]